MTLQAPDQATGFRRYVPGLASITNGVKNSVLADSRAALTVWAVVVPQSLAYATLAGVPSVNGLYAAVEFAAQKGLGEFAGKRSLLKAIGESLADSPESRIGETEEVLTRTPVEYSVP